MSVSRNHYLIAVQRPFLWVVNFLLLLTLIAGLMVASYYYGQNAFFFMDSSVERQLISSTQKADELKNRLLDLQLVSEANQQELEIAKASEAGLKAGMLEQQKQIIELQHELGLYRSLVSPERLKRQIQIQEVVLKDGQEAPTLHLVLAQLGKHNRMARGVIDIVLEGVLAGETKRLAMHDLALQQPRGLKFGFRYFQDFDVPLVIPEGFVIKQLELHVKPSGSDLVEIETKYDWLSFESSGGVVGDVRKEESKDSEN